MWSWKQTNVQVSQSSCNGTEHGHWLNSRKVKNILHWVWIKKNISFKIPAEKAYTPRTFKPRPAYFSEYPFIILSRNNISQHTQDF